MKKTITTILKVIGSIIVIPFAIAGGILYGLLLVLAFMFTFPFAIIADIWD